MTDDVQVPLIVKDVTLMSPGKWNGWNYTSEELNKAYVNTDWTDSVNTAIFLDHPSNPNNAAASWVGRLKNIRQMSDSTIKGDAEIWDQSTIYKLKIAKANFGLSPRVLGLDQNFENKETMTVQNYAFNSWSVVSKPAQDTAYLNLSDNFVFSGLVKNLNKEDKIESKVLAHSPEMMMNLISKMRNKETLTEEDMNYIVTHFEEMLKMKNKMPEIEEEMEEPKEYVKHSYSTDKLKKKVKGGRKEMSENQNTEEKVSEETETTEVAELSDADVLNIVSEDFDGFGAFSKEMRATNPSISLKDLAKKFKEHKEKLSFVEELSESEATVLLKKLLARIGVTEVPKSTENLAIKEMAKELSSLRESFKELSAKKEKIASPKSVKSVSTPNMEMNLVGKPASEGAMELAQQIFGMRR